MKILNIRYISQGNIISTLKNNEKFVIIYMMKKIYVKDKYKIKNKKNIINQYNKYIEVQLQGLLFKINYLDNNIIQIFTINKYNNPNNVLFLSIDLINNVANIEKINNYKKYKKYDILQIGIRIIQTFHPNYDNKKCIIYNDCFIYNNYNIIKKSFLNLNPIIYQKIKDLYILLEFYKEYIRYNKYLSNFYPYNINETFNNKLKRLIKYKKNISCSLIKNNTFISYLYNVVIKDIYFEPHKYMLSIFEYPQEIIPFLEEELIKEIDYYKKNKNIFLDKYYKTIDSDIQIYMKLFDNMENMKNKFLRNNINKIIKSEEFKNYIKNGFYYILNNKNDIVKALNIKNIDKFIIYLTKIYSKFIENYNLFIELLVIINSFYEYKNINIEYDFSNNLDEIKNIIFFTKSIDSNIYTYMYENF